MSRTDQGFGKAKFLWIALCILLAGLFLWKKSKPSPPKSAQNSTTSANNTSSNEDQQSDSIAGIRKKSLSKSHKRNSGAVTPPKSTKGKQLRDAGAVDTNSPNTENAKPKKHRFYLFGQVVNLQTKQPITQFVVRYVKVKSSSGYGGLSGLSNARKKLIGASAKEVKVSHPQGHFAIEVPLSNHLVSVSAKGFEPGLPGLSGVSASPGFGPFGKVYGLTKRGDNSLQAKVVQGQHHDPVQGAVVMALISAGNASSWMALSSNWALPSETRLVRTQANGRFTFQGLPDGVYHLKVTAKGFGSVNKKGIRLSKGEHKDLGVISLGEPAATLHGKFTDLSQKGPYRGYLNIHIFKTGSKAIQAQRSALIKSDGSYRIEGLRPGLIKVFATLRDSNGHHTKKKTVTLKSGETKRLDFTFERGKHQLYGRVTDSKNNPLKGARVQVKGFGMACKDHCLGRSCGRNCSGATRTDQHGRYQISGLKKSRYRFFIDHKGHRTLGGEATLKTKKTRHDIHLKGGRLEIEVFDKTTGKELTSSSMASLGWDGRWLRLYQNPGRKKQGKKLVFVHLPETELELKVSCVGYMDSQLKGLRAGTETRPKRLRILLDPAGQFMFKIHTTDNKAPTQVKAFVRQHGRWATRWASPKPSGTFLFQDLPFGPVQLKLSAHGYKEQALSIHVPKRGLGQKTCTLVSKKPSR